MILEVKLRSRGTEALKRPPPKHFGKSFPLKKRRIEYEAECLSNAPCESPRLDIPSQPENLSTKPQDLSIKSHPKLDPPSPTPPKSVEKKGNFGSPIQNVVQNFRCNNYVAHTTGPLGPVNLNQPAWPHQRLLAHYNPQSHNQYVAPPNHSYPYPMGQFVFPRESPVHEQMSASRQMPTFESPRAKHFEMPTHESPVAKEFETPIHPAHVKTEVMRLCDLGTMTHRIKVEPQETLRSLPVRDSVISHSNSQTQFHGGSSQYRETVSRSSCDSGVSSPSGSSCHSSSGAPVGISPTVVIGSVRYSCPKCSKCYSTVSGVSKHVQFHCSVGVRKSFQCKDCSKVYVSLGALKMHIRTHTLPCKCTVCGKAFSRPWLLQGHLRTHTGEKPFACSHCHRPFADRSNLRAHLQTHSDVKKYSCAKCSKTFSRMSLLTKHEESGCFTCAI